MAAQSAYGVNPNDGVDVGADHGWGGYQWPGGVPAGLLGTTDYRQVNGLKQVIRVTVRRELVPLFTLAFAIADRKHGYQIRAVGPGGDPWGPWSYENRPIGGTRVASNHSRGKAIDVNAPSNPQSYTFQSDLPPGLVADWERIGLCWGGRYGGDTKFDTMHFEYGYSPDDVARHTALAQQLLGSDPGNKEDWFDMATADELRTIVTEVVKAEVGNRLAALDGVIRETYNRSEWTNNRTTDMDLRAKDIDPVIRETYNRADWVNGKTDKIVALLTGMPLPPPPAPPVPTYTVKSGDTLGAVAKKFGVTVAQLVEWNGIADPDNIAIGQVLTVGKG